MLVKCSWGNTALAGAWRAPSLDGVETRGRRVGELGARTAGQGGAKGVGGVGDHGASRLGGELAENGVVGEMAGEVDGDQRAAAAIEGGRHRIGVEQTGVGVDVGEAHPRPEVERGGGRRGKGERRREQRVPRPHAGGHVGGVKRGGARVDRHGVPGSALLGQRSLEGLHGGAGGQPVAAQHLDHGSDIALVEGLAAVGQDGLVTHRHLHAGISTRAGAKFNRVRFVSPFSKRFAPRIDA